MEKGHPVKRADIEASGPDKGLLQYFRPDAPAHYSIEIKSYSLFSEKVINGIHKTTIFKAQGHKWRLEIYPKGNAADRGKDHVSLYLTLSTDGEPATGTVEAGARFFVQDKKNNGYKVFQDKGGKMWPFTAKASRFGFSQLLDLKSFQDEANGYLLNDTCKFGVEIFVPQKTDRWESMSMVKNPDKIAHVYKIKLSEVDKAKGFESAALTIGNRNWKVHLYPQGKENFSGKALSLYIYLANAATTLKPGKRVFGEFRVKLLDQSGAKKDYSRTVSRWFSMHKGNDYHAILDFILLTELHKPSSAYVKSDILKVEVQCLTMSVLTP